MKFLFLCTSLLAMNFFLFWKSLLDANFPYPFKKPRLPWNSFFFENSFAEKISFDAEKSLTVSSCKKSCAFQKAQRHTGWFLQKQNPFRQFRGKSKRVQRGKKAKRRAPPKKLNHIRLFITGIMAFTTADTISHATTPLTMPKTPPPMVSKVLKFLQRLRYFLI